MTSKLIPEWIIEEDPQYQIARTLKEIKEVLTLMEKHMRR